MSAELSQTARTSPPVSAADIDAAAQRISDVVTRTPLQLSERLSEAIGATVYLKREDLQVGPLVQAARRQQPAEAAVQR